MSTPVKLRLYCSICARNDFYMDRIRAVADGLGLDYTLEKITDDDVIDRMDLLMPCLYAYCPGCRVLNEQVTSEHPETLCTPAWRSMEHSGSGASPPATTRCGRRCLPYN